MTSRSTPGESGPAVDEVAEEDRAPVRQEVRRPRGARGRRGRGRSRARSSRDSSSDRQPCTSPTTSKGPWSSRRSLSRRSRTIVAAATSSTPRSTWTRRKPSRLRWPSDLRSCAAWRLTTPGAEVAVGPLGVAGDADAVGDVEHDRDGQHVVGLGELEQLLASGGLDVRGVDHREPAARQPLADDDAEHLEGVLAGVLVVLVVGDQATAEVAGDHLVGAEVLAREARLAGAGDADQDHEARRRDRVGRHAASVRVNTASCVGGPTSGSSGPIGANRTA